MDAHLHDQPACRTQSCPYRAGCRDAPTHCCLRCKTADDAGVDRLQQDPITGRSWKRAHGSECTSHCDRHMQASIGWPDLPPPPAPFKEFEQNTFVKCPKLGCWYSAPGRNSRTHCCLRCQLADEAKVRQLHTNPGPRGKGERWKMGHGPECTSHLYRPMCRHPGFWKQDDVKVNDIYENNTECPCSAG